MCTMPLPSLHLCTTCCDPSSQRRRETRLSLCIPLHSSIAEPQPPPFSAHGQKTLHQQEGVWKFFSCHVSHPYRFVSFFLSALYQNNNFPSKTQAVKYGSYPRIYCSECHLCPLESYRQSTGANHVTGDQSEMDATAASSSRVYHRSFALIRVAAHRYVGFAGASSRTSVSCPAPVCALPQRLWWRAAR
jgi:hypothetical protein